MLFASEFPNMSTKVSDTPFWFDNAHEAALGNVTDTDVVLVSTPISTSEFVAAIVGLDAAMRMGGTFCGTILEINVARDILKNVCRFASNNNK
jgi:hypothetical protein